MLALLSSLPIFFLLGTASLLLLRQKSYSILYTDGVREGLRTLGDLLPSLLMLCISVKLIGACGIIDAIAHLLSDVFAGGITDASLLPLILTRPLSGAASGAILSDLIERLGASSYPVFLAAVMMSSSDTCFYIHSVYFSCVRPKKSGGVLVLMTSVSFLSALICILVCNFWFKS